MLLFLNDIVCRKSMVLRADLLLQTECVRCHVVVRHAEPPLYCSVMSHVNPIRAESFRIHCFISWAFERRKWNYSFRGFYGRETEKHTNTGLSRSPSGGPSGWVVCPSWLEAPHWWVTSWPVSLWPHTGFCSRITHSKNETAERFDVLLQTS